MPFTDFLFVVRWWSILFIAGLFFLPLAKRVFTEFPDKGYIFSKILSVITVSYLLFLFGLLKITRFSSLTIYLTFLFCSVLSFIVLRKKKGSSLNFKTLLLMLFEEIIFFITLFSWSFIRGFNPDINGLEKFMDFGFVNSILRSDYFPPIDMWFPPKPINYYYFGHFITAVLTKATQIPSYITYNLMIATLFALTFIQSFSLGTALLVKAVNGLNKSVLRIICGGLLIASLITLSGNLHILYTFFKPYSVEQPVPFWELDFSFSNPCFRKISYEKVNDKGVREVIQCSESERRTPLSYPNSYWYPNATRFIYHTIHEFPIYSWVVADLHGHVVDMPIVILTLAVLFSFILKLRSRTPMQHTARLLKETQQQKHSIPSKLLTVFKNLELWMCLLIGFLLSVMYMTNAWDSLTYLLLTVFVLLYTQWSRITSKNITYNPVLYLLSVNRHIHTKTKNLFNKSLFLDLSSGFIFYIIIIISVFFIFSRPFSLNFDPSEIVGGIGVVGAPSFFLEKIAVGSKDHPYGSDRRDLLKKIFIPDHCKSLMNDSDQLKVTTQYNSKKLGPFLFEPDHCLRSPWWQVLILYGFFYFFVTILFIYLNKIKGVSEPDAFIIALVCVSTFNIIVPEFFYMKDIYPDHYRANTMFKLVFQAFIMLSVVSGYTIFRTINKNIFRKISLKLKPFYLSYVIFTVLLLTLIFTYPYFAIISYYNGLITYKNLDGLSYLKNRVPDDYEAIQWLNSNISGQPVILEAQGDSYTDYERVSANTGLPTVLGWYVHEWLWRGLKAPQSRSDEVKEIYESENSNKTKRLLKKYRVSYVIIGQMEIQKYPLLNEDKFKSFGKKVFQSGTTKIYLINKDAI